METPVSPLDLILERPTAEVLDWCVAMLVRKARMNLGLDDGGSVRSLAEARLAINAASALCDQLEGSIHADRLGEMLMHLADLRINFVEATKKVSSNP
ncbi:MAG: hypothetical protein FJX78_08010 [Armatimonadetes bacterium]|nr:hypothetical protein [Armatimonadota bacterium]